MANNPLPKIIRYITNGVKLARRNQAIMCGKESAMESLAIDDLGESYVRCGGGPQRPCAVYTLHTLSADRKTLAAISPFEMFEWTPSVAADGKVIYSRWDYVDRDNMPFMSLWSTNPDGTNPMHIYGNYTQNPHCIFEGRSIPGSSKIIATASGHHAITGGSLILIDTTKGRDGAEPIERITPEVCFPETEGWPSNWYSNPWPLAEDYYLVAWSRESLGRQAFLGGKNKNGNGVGIYLYDRFGNLELLYRDETISTMNPAPLRPRKTPTVHASHVDWSAKPEGTFILHDIYKGMKNVTPGQVKSLRVVAVPAKTHPTMNKPALGLTRDDPGKCVLGTVPVEKDGSAMFRAPAGVTLFFQALDKDGVCIQTMRSATYLQPGTSQSCVGCHENRYEAPVAKATIATRRAPSKLRVGPEGSWPLRFDTLVQPVLNTHCVGCHNPKGKGKKLNLTQPAAAYARLTRYGKPSLYNQVWTQYRKPISIPGEGMAANSLLWKRMNSGHGKVKLSPEDKQRVLIWMDTYAQYLGSFDAAQEQRLNVLKKRWADMLILPASPANIARK